MTAAPHREDLTHRPDVLNLSCPACWRTYEVLVATGQVTEYRAPGTDDEEPWAPPADPPARDWSRPAAALALLGLAVLVALALLEVRR